MTSESAASAEFARRHIPFDRWFNVRDIGGYPTTDGGTVAWERLYRAAAPTRLADYDWERARVLNLRTQIDLRGADEAAAFSPLLDLGVAYHMAPVATLEMLDDLDQRTGIGPSAQRYLTYLDVGADGIRRTFELLGDPATYPVTVHCGLGNHRTGVVIALLLDLLRVSRESIVLDFALTNPEVDRLAMLWRERGWMTDGDSGLGPMFRVDPSNIAGFLVLLDQRYGGAEAYLRGIGVLGETLEGIRAALLEVRS